MGHPLKKADAIFVLGSRDTRVAEYAAKLYFDGWAPIIVFSGFRDSTKAEVFSTVAYNLGVPKHAILIENRSQNTRQNYEFMKRLLNKHSIDPKTLITVQKSYIELRTYATGKIWWPNIELIVTSPPITIENYPNESNSKDEQWVHAMVGDLQRIKEYPSQGFQIVQEIPSNVWDCYKYLVSLGYTKRLIQPALAPTAP